MTLQEIADRFGITRQRVGQIEREAMRKLREALADDPDIQRLLATKRKSPGRYTPCRVETVITPTGRVRRKVA